MDDYYYCYQFTLLLFDFGGPAIQFPDKYIETYSYLLMPNLSLAYFQPTFLKLSHKPFDTGLLPSSILQYFLYFLLCCWWCGCVAGPWYPLFFLSSPSSLLLFLFILSACHSLLSLNCLAISHSALQQTKKVFQASKVIQLHRVKQMQHKKMKHMCASLSKCFIA